MMLDVDHVVLASNQIVWLTAVSENWQLEPNCVPDNKGARDGVEPSDVEYSAST